MGGCSVKPVARDGVPDARQVHADLVCPAGADPHFEQGKAAEAAQHAVFAPGGPAARQPRRHPGAADRVTRDGLLDAPGFAPDVPVDQREVDLLDLALGELPREIAMGGVIPGYQQDPAGKAVEPVHDAGPQFAGGGRERPEMMQERIDQRPGEHARARMDHHSGRLVHGDHIGVLIKYAEGNLFRFGAQRGRSGRVDVDGIARAGDVRGTPRLAVYAHAARPDPVLDTRAAELRQLLLQDPIQALAGLFRGDQDADHEGIVASGDVSQEIVPGLEPRLSR